MGRPMSRPVVVWFSEDLRLDDQAAVAAVDGRSTLFVYVMDTDERPLGGAAQWWLGKSLAALRQNLEARGARLDILKGSGEKLIREIARASGAEAVHWGRRYGHTVERLKRLKADLNAEGIAAQGFNTKLLREPWHVVSDSGQPYRVFTPFWRRWRALGPLPAAYGAPKRLRSAPWPKDAPKRAALAELGLQPEKPDWSGGLAEAWTPGEAGARARLDEFLGSILLHYAKERDRPDREFDLAAEPAPEVRRDFAAPDRGSRRSGDRAS